MKPALQLLALFGLSLTSSLASASEWPFTAYLDGKEIGHHRFAITESDNAITLTSEADFQVKILFINAYQYQHRASEVWQNDCLQKLEARTEENRDVSLVVGRQQSGSFKVEGPKGQLALPDCAMTFAYWNPKMLQQDKLLNPQTGEWLDVDIRRIGRETIEVRGQPVTAERYRLTAPKMKIDLWYSDKQEWLALESTTPEGYLISYKLR
ncbi:MAG: hypothetical protein CVU15_08450 [Betaproteobacteria bacterium HGW-Betaproteobacteria-1]|jgi:hypothetical protein|nr:MAG: hypothetical protein CVU15_08450 [Betaproteobacteria bacterium HGW-Betaproteobacteria-1]